MTTGLGIGNRGVIRACQAPSDPTALQTYPDFFLKQGLNAIENRRKRRQTIENQNKLKHKNENNAIMIAIQKNPKFLIRETNILEKQFRLSGYFVHKSREVNEKFERRTDYMYYGTKFPKALENACHKYRNAKKHPHRKQYSTQTQNKNRNTTVDEQQQPKNTMFKYFLFEEDVQKIENNIKTNQMIFDNIHGDSDTADAHDNEHNSNKLNTVVIDTNKDGFEDYDSYLQDGNSSEEHTMAKFSDDDEENDDRYDSDDGGNNN